MSETVHTHQSMHDSSRAKRRASARGLAWCAGLSAYMPEALVSDHASAVAARLSAGARKDAEEAAYARAIDEDATHAGDAHADYYNAVGLYFDAIDAEEKAWNAILEAQVTA